MPQKKIQKGRTQVKELPKKEKKLSRDEQKKIKGGAIGAGGAGLYLTTKPKQ